MRWVRVAPDALDLPLLLRVLVTAITQPREVLKTRRWDWGFIGQLLFADKPKDV